MPAVAEAVRETTLLPLREEVGIFPGPPAQDGSPSWTLHDPARNRFYRVGWLEFEMLSRWNGGTKESILSSIAAETTLSVEPEDFDDLGHFLLSYDLLRVSSAESTAKFAAKAKLQRQSFFSWLMQNYLFLRVPLLRPDAFLTATQNYISWAFSRGFALTILFIGLIGLYGIARQWDVFRSTFVDLFNLRGAFWFAITLGCLKVFHELGHAYTAKRLGCRVPTMGVALLVMIPVLYTDVNESWKLTRRRDRLAIGIAGVTTELCCAAIALFAWSFLPDGAARSVAFLVATTTWVTTVLINASPFMRYDGYYVLSDWLEMPNLHTRTFALARWWIRETLFGLGNSVPEEMPVGRRNFLIAFAFLTWTYRFTLFLTIALIVYHFAVKVLGVAMASVEIGYFLMFPVLGEVLVWWRRRGDMSWNKRTVFTAIAAAAVGGLLLVPWRSAIEAPALLKSWEHREVFVPDFGVHVVSIDVKDGQLVEKGQRLFQLASPDLDHKLGQVRSDLRIYASEMDARNADAEQLTHSLVTEREYEAALTELRGLVKEQAKLDLTAPISGRVVDVAQAVKPGDWLPAKFRLLAVIDRSVMRVEAYVDEADLDRIAVGDTATFFADLDSRVEIPVKVVQISQASTRNLSEPSLASTYGGPIDVRKQKQNELVPNKAIYHVLLSVPRENRKIDRVVRGHVVMNGKAVSLAGRAWRSIQAVFIRESGA